MRGLWMDGGKGSVALEAAPPSWCTCGIVCCAFEGTSMLCCCTTEREIDGDENEDGIPRRDCF